MSEKFYTERGQRRATMEKLGALNRQIDARFADLEKERAALQQDKQRVLELNACLQQLGVRILSQQRSTRQLLWICVFASAVCWACLVFELYNK